MLQQHRGDELGDERPQIPSPIIEGDETDNPIPRAPKSQSNSADADEFVDARESFGPPSPRSTRNSANLKKSAAGGGKKASLSRQGSAAGAGGGGVQFGSKKTPEELELENATLRQTLNEHSKRLQMWEAQSQSQTAALRMAESFRVPGAGGGKEGMPTARRPVALAREGSGRKAASEKDPAATAAAGQEAQAKIEALERQLAEAAAERAEWEKAEKKSRAENAKLQVVVGKYRERWEQLKQGARERQSKRTEGSSTPAIPEEREKESLAREVRDEEGS